MTPGAAPTVLKTAGMGHAAERVSRLRIVERDLVKALLSPQDIVVGGVPTFVAGNGKSHGDIVVRVVELREVRPVEACLSGNPMGLVDQFLAVHRQAEARDQRRAAGRCDQVVCGFHRRTVFFATNLILNRSGQNDPLSSVLHVGPEGPTP